MAELAPVTPAMAERNAAREKVKGMKPEEAQKALEKHGENIQDILKLPRDQIPAAFNKDANDNPFEMHVLAGKIDPKADTQQTLSKVLGGQDKNTNYGLRFSGPQGPHISVVDNKTGTQLTGAFIGSSLKPPAKNR